MLSKSAEYALRALLRLAVVQGEGPVTSARLAERVRVPENYLSKLLHRLQQEGLVASRRGRGGGFVLARPADQVRLAEVIEPFDDVMERRCLLGRPACRDDDPCAAHEAWREAVGRLRAFFRDTTLADLGVPGEEAPGEDAPGAATARPAAAGEARPSISGGRSSDER